MEIAGTKDCVLVIDKVQREDEGNWKCILFGSPGIPAKQQFFKLELTNVQDCTWGEWQPWEPCRQQAGSCLRVKRRKKFQPATGGGRSCTGSPLYAEECDNQECR